MDFKTIKGKEIKFCTKCKSKKCYTNPLEKCGHCGKRFCLDCLTRGMVNKDMKNTDELKTICDDCIVKYKSIK